MRPGDLPINVGEVTELLRQLIRNGCVNDGRPGSGEEIRNAEMLAAYLGTAGLEVERFAPPGLPGRQSLVARLAGTDPSAPAVCLMGHTDVVPANPAGWREDPFGADLIRGELWGRGAVDMLNLTAAMAVVFRHIARRGNRPRGDLIFFAVADEEAAGTHGAGWMTDHHWDAIACDYVLTENGGIVSGGSGRPLTVAMNVAEKGFAWRRLVVRGTPGHGSMPYGADNAMVTAAEVVRRIAAYQPRSEISELWRRRVAAMGLPDDLAAGLVDPGRIRDTLASVPTRGAAAHFHACTHTTFSPNLAHGGVKANVIPDRVDLDIDIRTLPGETPETVSEHLRAALGDDLFEAVEITSLGDAIASESPVDTPVWAAMTAATRRTYPDADLVPAMIVGLTDARFFRAKGTVAYGAGLLSTALSSADFSARFHGHDERIDLASLELTARFYADTLDALWSS
jgi:acetylornithine deacetylase/succinyl-diaminopimelate desuccinylase-like protein